MRRAALPPALLLLLLPLLPLLALVLALLPLLAPPARAQLELGLLSQLYYPRLSYFTYMHPGYQHRPETEHKPAVGRSPLAHLFLPEWPRKNGPRAASGEGPPPLPVTPFA